MVIRGQACLPSLSTDSYIASTRLMEGTALQTPATEAATSFCEGTILSGAQGPNRDTVQDKYYEPPPLAMIRQESTAVGGDLQCKEHEPSRSRLGNSSRVAFADNSDFYEDLSGNLEGHDDPYPIYESDLDRCDPTPDSGCRGRAAGDARTIMHASTAARRATCDAHGVAAAAAASAVLTEHFEEEINEFNYSGSTSHAAIDPRMDLTAEGMHAECSERHGRAHTGSPQHTIGPPQTPSSEPSTSAGSNHKFDFSCSEEYLPSEYLFDTCETLAERTVSGHVDSATPSRLATTTAVMDCCQSWGDPPRADRDLPPLPQEWENPEHYYFHQYLSENTFSLDDSDEEKDFRSESLSGYFSETDSYRQLDELAAQATACYTESDSRDTDACSERAIERSKDFARAAQIINERQCNYGAKFSCKEYARAPLQGIFALHEQPPDFATAHESLYVLQDAEFTAANTPAQGTPRTTPDRRVPTPRSTT